jgi:hypothetical protein
MTTVPPYLFLYCGSCSARWILESIPQPFEKEQDTIKAIIIPVSEFCAASWSCVDRQSKSQNGPTEMPFCVPSPVNKIYIYVYVYIQMDYG